MAVTNVQLKQTISALVSGVGIRTQHSIGGNNILSDDVDIAFGFTIKCGDSANRVKLRYHNTSKSNKPTLETYGSGDITCDQEIGASGAGNAEIVQDASMTDVASIVTIVAVYFEAPAANSAIITVKGEPDSLGADLELRSAGASALLVPRTTADTNALTNFDFSTASVGDIVKVVVLGNSS